MNVIQYGLGPIGMRILDLAARSETLEVRGAVDIDPQKVGRDVGTLLGGPGSGVRVVSHIDDVPREAIGPHGATALHAVGSHLEEVWPQLRQLLDAGFSVVSTCEELSFPWHRYPGLSREIDGYARTRGLSVLGTGVNPGFVMDVLALCLTAMTFRVRRVWVSRTVDVSRRRLPLQRKVGVGLQREAFDHRVREGAVGHVGLEESVRLIAYGLGWKLTEVKNAIEPTVSAKDSTDVVKGLESGDVDGLHQTSIGSTQDGRQVSLDLTMRVGGKQEDEVVVEGDERHRLVVPEGIPGDSATAAITINSATMMPSAGEGLLNMVDVGLPRAAR